MGLLISRYMLCLLSHFKMLNYIHNSLIKDAAAKTIFAEMEKEFVKNMENR